MDSPPSMPASAQQTASSVEADMVEHQQPAQGAETEKKEELQDCQEYLAMLPKEEESHATSQEQQIKVPKKETSNITKLESSAIYIFIAIFLIIFVKFCLKYMWNYQVGEEERSEASTACGDPPRVGG